MRKLYWVLIIIAVVLIANEFVIFPIFPYSAVSASCPGVAEYNLFNEIGPIPPMVSRAEIILTGTVGDSWWVTTDPLKGNIETYTKVHVDKLIKGPYGEDDIIVRKFGGCDVRTNYCTFTSLDKGRFEKGMKYLMFLSEPNSNNVYSTWGTCIRPIISVEKDNEGNEIVKCFAHDTENCTNGFVKLDDLVKQVQD
ncbi:hypothetical protein ACFLQO_01060 [Candidatus Aenigmatarchaeota archaeon]